MAAAASQRRCDTVCVHFGAFFGLLLRGLRGADDSRQRVDRDRVDSTRSSKPINQQHTLPVLILGTFVEERQWRGGLIVEHFPQMSSHHNDLFIVPQKRPVQITVHIIYI